MAIQTTQVLPAPVLEGALTAFTKKLTPLIGQQIDTTKFDPKVAAQTQLQKDASAAAADPYSVDTGITGNDVYDGKQCTDGGGTYTPPSCTNNGNPESEAACEGIQLGTCATSGSNSHCAAATTAAECSAATISGGGNIGANACIFTNNIFSSSS